ncbi:hypothetical protein [Streptomyces sp. NPDC046685]|uniref:hypothetical protein n=1 Tax=Streptomyces sp. NPDC046685 TaxID=3157202 RepID=UPI0033F42B41
MQPHVTRALQDWHAAWTVHERAAQLAMSTAFPALESMAPPTGCCHPRMAWERDGEGSGTMCLDDHGRATIEFEDVPKAALGAAMKEIFGPDWFDEGEGGFAMAEPGNYSYSDESTYAEYEFDVHKDGTVGFTIGYVKIEDIVVILDALETALAETRAGGTPGAAT